MKNTKIANLNVTEKTLFIKWIELTKPLHKLAEQPSKVLALLLYYRFLYSRDINDDKLLWKIVFDYDTKSKIKEELNIKDGTFQNILTTLRKRNIITDNTIVSTYIPSIENNSKEFKIIFNFKIL